MQLENYPLLLFVLLVVMVFVLIEPAVTEKSGEVILKIAFLSIHLFAFALSLNLIYAVLVPVLGIDSDPLAVLIANLATTWSKPLSETAFAMIYGFPFLLAAIVLVILNSYYLYAEGQFRVALKSRLFWESFLLAIALAFYQYAAFILFEKAAG